MNMRKPHLKKKITLHPRHDNDSFDDEMAEHLFDLYVKQQEVRQISQCINDLSLLPDEERAALLDDHFDIISDMIASFFQDTFTTIDGMYLDAETMEMSLEVMNQMRQTMTKLQLMLEETVD